MILWVGIWLLMNGSGRWIAEPGLNSPPGGRDEKVASGHFFPKITLPWIFEKGLSWSWIEGVGGVRKPWGRKIRNWPLGNAVFLIESFYWYHIIKWTGIFITNSSEIIFNLDLLTQDKENCLWMNQANLYQLGNCVLINTFWFQPHILLIIHNCFSIGQYSQLFQIWLETSLLIDLLF